MSLWSRITNLFRSDRLSREIDEELQSHIEEAIEHGRAPAEARRAFGSPLQQRERSRDIRLAASLDSLRADTIFGWRQLMKRKVTSAAAILSLALAIGSCTSAFRLIDALLLRPLPVDHPERLYALAGHGKGLNGQPALFEFWSYQAIRQMRSSVKEQAELIAISNANPADLTHGAANEIEEVSTQYVSGWMFASFGLRPALGRLLTENDDRIPGAHPYAVLSYEYWSRRFGRDPNVIGKTFRLGDEHVINVPYEIAGVGPERFTGTEPGAVTDIFLPTMMYSRSINEANLIWLRTFVKLKPDVPIEPVRDRLRAAFQSLPGQYNGEMVSLDPAATGVSWMQGAYRLSLAALGVLVGLVLLIACANVANLISAQGASRAREMAMRVSIGAGRWRLVQLVLVESLLLACLAAAAGGIFAWWSAPVVARMIDSPGNPARIFLPLDGRVMGFGVALTLGVTLLFGLAPALRASAIQPASALKGGEAPRSYRRWMHSLIAVQAAFCFLVLFVAGLFVTTFHRLVNQPTGFSAARILNLDATADRPQPAGSWDDTVERLRAAPGVEAAALARWPLLGGSTWSARISINGEPPGDDLAYRLSVSPGWADVLRIPFVDGRDFLASDTYPDVAIVNQAFARRYFGGQNVVGNSFEIGEYGGKRIPSRIIGLVRDARYRDLHEPLTPTAYFPIRTVDGKGGWLPRSRGTFVVRTSGENPLALASILRREVSRVQPEIRVKTIQTQIEINQAHAIRERLLATLALFFAIVAVMLAGVGLYGVLDYTVLQRRRELGIRMALGATASHVARGVTVDVFAMLMAGAAAGLGLGLVSARYISSLLYQVKATDAGILALPSVTMLAAALLAALPAIVRAVRIDPAITLRNE